MPAREPAIGARAANYHLSKAQERWLLRLLEGPQRVCVDTATWLLRLGLIDLRFAFFDRNCQCSKTFGLTYEGMKVAVHLQKRGGER